jgi:uncharacterized protein
METWDAHVTIGPGIEVQPTIEGLLRSMDATHIERALVAPADHFVAVHNEDGNALTAAAAIGHPDRFIAYATANPWLGRDGLDLLRRAGDGGARLLLLDPGRQGFSLLSGVADGLIEFAVELGWPVFIRPSVPHGLPLQLAEVALRYPHGRFVMGGGVPDFEFDGVPCLQRAPNLWATTAWLGEVLSDSSTGPGRLVFASDYPYSEQGLEVGSVTESVPADVLAQIMAGTMRHILGE